MIFRYVIKSKAANGEEDTLATDIPKSEIIIGRGSGCDIVLDSRYVSLKHAKVSASSSEVVVEDVGSLGGVLVNDAVVNRAVLKRGDIIRLGDVELSFGIEGDACVITRERQIPAPENADNRIVYEANKLELRSRLPSIKSITFTLSALTFIFFFVRPFWGESKSSWSTGAISRAHKFVEHECASCHAGSFKEVADKECLTCHNLAPHAKLFTEKKIAEEGKCVDCHTEHKGDHKLVIGNSKLCISCHDHIESFHPKEKVASMMGWSNHPEFRVKLEKKEDTTPLKFNHKVHLRGPLDGRDGKVTLQCADCHSGAGLMTTATFETSCRTCHSLEFDRRLPGRETPHGNPDTVYEFLYSSYAALALTAADDPALADAFDIRPIPGKMSPEEMRAEARAFAKKESRDAEKLLFSKTACALCHMTSILQTQEEGKSQYEVKKVNIPQVWLPHSKFSHQAHEIVSCESCHTVRDSEKTSDVLLPDINNCRKCHGEPRSSNAVPSDCVLCHNYHLSLPIESEKKKSLSKS